MKIFLVLWLALMQGCGYVIEQSKTGVGLELQSFDESDDEEDKDEKVRKAYQIGDEFGKHPIGDEEFKTMPSAKGISYATGRLGGGTVFFIGEHDGKLIFATNHHVCPRARSCEDRLVRMPLLGIKLKVTKLLGSWSQIDNALFIAEANSDEDKESLLPYGKNFNFSMKLEPGMELITVGFGFALNPERQLMINYDEHCRVYSEDVRYIEDPDELNKADYKTWSFANGCDISHGDSGSAMVDRKSGDVVGIIWTGRIPKNEIVRDPKYLDEILEENDDEEIWSQLSYAVPASKIGEHFENLIDEKDADEDFVGVLRSILGK